jgi:RNA polymerase sigma-70 factor (ECF subfamily)
VIHAASSERAAELDALFRAQRKSLRALAYRLTGSVEDAEDVVQEAFARLLAQPAAPPEAGPWLVRVATRLGVDALRRRRRRAYTGPWLPAPLEAPDADWLDVRTGEESDPEVRYGRAESATFAFLIALEALSPRQRAVLLLRDVLGYSAEEAAAALGATPGGVRVAHLRARRALAAYDAERCVPSPELEARHRDALQRFLAALLTQDARGLEALLSESVTTRTDSAGAYTALAAPMAGRTRVARFYLRAALHRHEGGVRTEIRLVNGLPAALITLERPVRRQAPRTLLCCALESDGRIRAIHTVLAPRKLAPLFDA